MLVLDSGKRHETAPHFRSQGVAPDVTLVPLGGVVLRYRPVFAFGLWLGSTYITIMLATDRFSVVVRRSGNASSTGLRQLGES